VSLQVETAWINTFSDSFMHLAQEKRAKLVQTVDVESTKGEFAFFDQIGQSEMIQRTSRHQDTPFTPVPHDRRRLSMLDFEWSDIIDSQDQVRTLKDPQSAYAQSASYAAARRMNLSILQGIFADAQTGKTGATTVAFPAGQQIAVDYVETGSTVNSFLTIGKLRAARALLEEAEIDEDEQITIVVSPRQKQALLATTEVTSSDYNSDVARQLEGLKSGLIDTFMGFKFVTLAQKRMLLDGNGRVRVPVYAKTGVKFGIGEAPVSNAAPDPTKGYNIRLHTKCTFGAIRMEEAKVVEIKCLAS
jgi:hypothetical protein